MSDNSNQLKVAVLYDENSNHVFTIKNYLDMFGRYSRHQITYVPATGNRKCGKNELEQYDAVIIFYSIRVCVRKHMSFSYKRAIKKYKGEKILFVQDDYEYTERTRRAIEKLGIDTVYTVVPEKYIRQVYREERFREVKFYNILTGYISDEMKNFGELKPIAQRNVLIGYRGRNLDFCYGSLSREKLNIGIWMKEQCARKGIKNIDIEWEEKERIYSQNWLQWLADCKVTLGTESGSNIFDDCGFIRLRIWLLKMFHPGITYEQVYQKLLYKYEGNIRMNQISPKVFEAISLKTALVLFEGEYSGILTAGRNYIELKKDCSNIDEVFDKIQDDDYLQKMADLTYDDIMNDERLSYRYLIRMVDDNINGSAKIVNGCKDNKSI